MDEKGGCSSDALRRLGQLNLMRRSRAGELLFSMFTRCGSPADDLSCHLFKFYFVVRRLMPINFHSRISSYAYSCPNNTHVLETGNAPLCN